MTYLNKYPETLSKLFIHEPLIFMDTLEGKDEIQKFHLDMYQVYLTKGRNAAMHELGNRYSNELDYSTLVEKQKKDKANNWDYCFQYEWREYPFAKVDWRAAKSHRDKVAILYGVDCIGFFCVEAGKSIAEYLGNEYVESPGAHIGVYDESQKISKAFIKLCRKQSLFLDEPKL